jgi:glycosyltransferase involved in cell wall biosynthesis
MLSRLAGRGVGIALADPNVVNVTEAISSLLRDEDLRIEMSAKGKSVAKEYTLERWTEFIRERLEKAWS